MKNFKLWTADILPIPSFVQTWRYLIEIYIEKGKELFIDYRKEESRIGLFWFYMGEEGFVYKYEEVDGEDSDLNYIPSQESE